MHSLQEIHKWMQELMIDLQIPDQCASHPISNWLVNYLATLRELWPLVYRVGGQKRSELGPDFRDR
jgi:hypothetical protein